MEQRYKFRIWKNRVSLLCSVVAFSRGPRQQGEVQAELEADFTVPHLASLEAMLGQVATA